jgi:Zn-dependent protease with chaperone function
VPTVTVGPGMLRVSALWVRVDENRVKLTTFVALFVLGSAVLLDLALVAVPGTLLSIAFADEPDVWFRSLATTWLWVLAGLLLLGGLAAAVQLANAEDWVRNRFAGRDLGQGEAPELLSAVNDMKLAAGLPTMPRILVLESPADSINALALGTTRSSTLIGVTSGFLESLTPDEQRAVVATLSARIIAGDIMFGTALAALMGPLKAIRESRKATGSAVGAVADSGCTDPGCPSGCGDGCIDGLGDTDGCGGAIAMVIFVAVVIALTYLAVITAAWIVTLWGRALHRTAYEKADAEGMLLLKDPRAMLTALRKTSTSSNAVGDGDASYDGIFYTATSGTARVERVEQRRYNRLREVLGTEGLAAEPLPER